ncbi:membrane integrity-associated transporter subunit PqiA [Tatumella terrea]|uniref:membrane integrity-associated transporter subunit PqiA n=1 Tax=Tatumella terrea TaxID=419007 RepID=UPI0031DBD236
MNITRCEQLSDADTWVLCPQCDLACRLPALSTGKKAVCPRCHSTLSMRWPDPGVRPTVYGISALLMLVLANLFPFISMHVAGISSEISLTRIPDIMVSDDFSPLAFIFLMLVQVIPACCLVILLLLVNRVKMPHGFRVMLGRGFFHLRNWGMAEIFMAGVLVSFVKLMAYGEIGLGISFWPWCLFCILQLRAFQCVDKRQLWLHIQPELPVFKTPVAGVSGLAQGMRACPCCTAILPVDRRTCPRCFTRGEARKRQSLQWTLALLLTSVMIYVPANIMPIMVTSALGSTYPSNIMAGVVLLWSDGSYPVAMIIFIASIMVPTLKMLAIGWLSWNASGRGRRDNEKMHLVYDVVEFVGRWSMIDVFVIAILSSLVRMGGLMNITPAPGALLFATVVILTMFAALTFDPRLLWDRETENRVEESGVETE